jgi:hypothetical protein
MHYHQYNKINVLKNKLNHKIEGQLKGIEFEDEDEKLKVYNKQFQIERWGTKHICISFYIKEIFGIYIVYT